MLKQKLLHITFIFFTSAAEVILAAFCFLLPGSSGVSLFFLALVGIGAGQYFALQRLTRKKSIPRAAEQWLLSRRLQRNRSQLMRLKHAMLWSPSILVIAISLFLPETLGFASHILHPRAGKLLGYTVSIPNTWVILFDQPEVNPGHWSYVRGYECKGMLRSVASSDWQVTSGCSGFGLYGDTSGDPHARLSPYDTELSAQAIPFGEGAITCWEYTNNYYRSFDHEAVHVRCSTARDDFYGWFDGDRKALPGFYNLLRLAKRVPR